jgi:RNA polymerase sigma-70 factor (ECF subfamily)
MRKGGVDQRAGDFAEFYRQARGGCLRAVYAVVGDRQLAEDLVSEAFARAWASWQKVSRHPAPEAWIVRTAFNLRVSWWRRRRREVRWEGQDMPVTGYQDPGFASSSPRIVAAVARLPDRQRQVVALRILLDLDIQATAAALGISPGAVKSHFHRALATLRTELSRMATEEVIP